MTMVTLTTAFRSIGALPKERWFDEFAARQSPLSREEIAECWEACAGWAVLLDQAINESALSDEGPLQRRNLLNLKEGDDFKRYAAHWQAFAEANVRLRDPGYKASGGEPGPYYQGERGIVPGYDLSIAGLKVVFIGGAECLTSRGRRCANGERYDPSKPMQGMAVVNDRQAPSINRSIAAALLRYERWFPRKEPAPSDLPYRVAFIPAGNRNRPGTAMNSGGPRYITVHETGNPGVGTDAENHRVFTHKGGGSESVSFHLVVDDREAIQLLPFTEIGWHAGDGCDSRADDLGCFDSIAIETCVNSDGNWEQTLRNLILLLVKLIRENPGLSVERIRQHNGWSGKNCPRRIRESGRWDWVLAEVKRELADAA
jgi:hypothetical protein